MKKLWEFVKARLPTEGGAVIWGVALISVGALMIYPPAGLIVCGVLTIAYDVISKLGGDED